MLKIQKRLVLKTWKVLETKDSFNFEQISEGFNIEILDNVEGVWDPQFGHFHYHLTISIFFSS